jgi:uncharacterized RDD family membrane protein YckC
VTQPAASLGTLGARTAAWVIDAIPYFVIPQLVARSAGWTWAVAAALIVGVAWTILPEARGGSIGKRLLGLRTLDIATALPIGFARSAVRWLVKYVGCTVLPVGYLWFFRSPARQTFADLAARTVVVTPLAAGDVPQTT